MIINIHYAYNQFKSIVISNDISLEASIKKFYVDYPELIPNKNLEPDLKKMSVYSQNTKLDWHQTPIHYGFNEGEQIHLFPYPDLNLNDIAKLQGVSRGFLTRKKYEFKRLSQESLTQYPIFIKGDDPRIRRIQKQHRQGDKIAVVATAGFKVLEIACALVKKQEVVNEKGEIIQERVPKIIIVDNSKKVCLFWTKFKQFMNDDSKMVNSYLFNKNYEKFLKEAVSLWDLWSMGDSRKQETRLEELTAHFAQLISLYDYDYLRALTRQAWIIPQSWDDTATFKKIKNLADFHGINAIYAYPSNLIGLVKGIKFQHQILHNIALLNPVLSIHSSFCRQHNRPERFLFFKPDDNPRTLFLNHCITEISAADVIQSILSRNLSAFDIYHYLTDATQGVEYRYDINCADYQGNTALLSAVVAGNIILVEAFCKMGAYVNHRNNNYQSALIFALLDNRLDMVKILIENGYRLGHPFDKAYIEKSTSEIVAYLQKKLEEAEQNEQIISSTVQKYLENNHGVEQALNRIRRSYNFPNDCKKELTLLHTKIKESINDNDVEIVKWFLNTNFIQIAKIPEHHNPHHLDFTELAERAEEIFELLINHGDSLVGTDPWVACHGSNADPCKLRPLSECMKRHNFSIANFLIEIQRKRYENLEQALGVGNKENENLYNRCH